MQDKRDYPLFKGQIRKELGTGSARKLRRVGDIPLVIYMIGNTKSLHVSVSRKCISIALKNKELHARIIDLEIEEMKKTIRTVIKNIQLHPVNDEILSLEVQEIAKGKRFKTLVNVSCINLDSSPGIKKGGVLTMRKRQLECYCISALLPTSIQIDVGKMEVGEAKNLRDITLPDGLDFVKKEDVVILSISSKGAA